MKKLYFLICFSFLAVSIRSQTATFDFNLNNINATVLNGGDLFNPINNRNGQFEVPKGSFKSTIYTAGLWIAGLDSINNLHLVAAEYRTGATGSFIPGPVSEKIYSGKNQKYDKIFYLTKNDIDYHITHYKYANYTMIANIAGWPGNGDTTKGEAFQLAPFMDLNQNKLYEPMLGEYPLIPGTACAFCIYNDDQGFAENMKVEVHQFVYGYSEPTTVLNNTLFVTYKIYNRSKSKYHDTYVAQFMDYDLGNYIDDAICNDSNRSVMYVYNSDDNDEGVNGYGLNPPAMGCAFLNHKMKRSSYFWNDFSSYGNPSTYQHYYNYMIGYFKNGSKIPPLVFNNPLTPIGDMRFLGVTDSFDFEDNQSYCFTVAHIYARATSGGAKGSVDVLIQSADYVKKYFNNRWIDDACDGYLLSNGIPKEEKQNSILQIFPNPAHSSLRLTADLEQFEHQKYQILNALGQICKEDIIQAKETTVDLLELPSGLYFLRVGTQIQKFVKQ